VKHYFCWRLNSFACFGITGDTWWSMMSIKTAKAPDFNALTLSQGIGHALQQAIYCCLHIA
jgi:hypothetical protein